jgi:hypothetical protein
MQRQDRAALTWAFILGGLGVGCLAGVVLHLVLGQPDWHGAFHPWMLAMAGVLLGVGVRWLWLWHRRYRHRGKIGDE